MKGRTSKENYIRLSQKMKINNPMFNLKITKKVVKTLKKQGHYKKISERMKLNNPMKNPEIAKKVNSKKKGIHSSPSTEFKKGQIPWNKGKHHSEETKRKIAEKSPKALHIRPTSLEKQMINIIQKYNLPYKYTGNGSFLIGYKNPDFININGEKICIEVANFYHHPKDYEQKRIKYFKKWGWDCIVFRTEKLSEIEVLNKINKMFQENEFKVKIIKLEKYEKKYQNSGNR